MIANIKIRRATLRDALNLTVLRQQVWIATYATEGIREEFSQYVLSSYTPAKMQLLLESNDRVLLIAEIDDHLVGYVEIAFSNQCPIDPAFGPEICVLYVLERFLGQGIGYQLLTEAEKTILDQGAKRVWLDSYYENERALSFYERQGFKRVGTSYFEEMKSKYENVVMMKELGK